MSDTGFSLLDLTCPHCGAKLNLSGANGLTFDVIKCEYCDSKYQIVNNQLQYWDADNKLTFETKDTPTFGDGYINELVDRNHMGNRALERKMMATQVVQEKVKAQRHTFRFLTIGILIFIVTMGVFVTLFNGFPTLQNIEKGCFIGPCRTATSFNYSCTTSSTCYEAVGAGSGSLYTLVNGDTIAFRVWFGGHYLGQIEYKATGTVQCQVFTQNATAFCSPKTNLVYETTFGPDGLVQANDTLKSYWTISS